MQAGGLLQYPIQVCATTRCTLTWSTQAAAWCWRPTPSLIEGDPSSFAQDCYRYNDLVVRGWLVLRFPWAAVVLEPWLARRTLGELVGLRR